MIRFLIILAIFWVTSSETAVAFALENPSAQKSSPAKKSRSAQKKAASNQEKPVQKQTKPALEEDKPVDITADHVSQHGGKDIIKAWGRVVIRHGGQILRADRVKINNKTGRGEAFGHVLMLQKDGTRLKAKRALFNIKSKRGKVFDTYGTLARNYYITGKEVTRLSEGHYKLTKSSLTTCRGKLPAWKIEANWLDLRDNDRALFTGGVFKVLNVPILYMPIGYLPINRDRKSGFLFPTFGTSNTGGFNIKNTYYWAINRSSDATFAVDYMEKRGVRPELEYRYTPSKNTKGQFRGSYLSDNVTGGTFWKVDMTHKQTLPYDFNFNGKLDLESDSSFNKTFEDNPDVRTRRSSDSFASLNRTWTNNTLDILTRFRNSTEDNVDDTFTLLPQITYKTQRHTLGNSPIYFNQDSSYTHSKIDLNSNPDVDDDYNVHRVDFHPQLSIPLNIAPWMTLTPTVGVRETFYSQGLTSTNQRLSGFSRESFDIQAALEGPKINKIFHLDSTRFPKMKHLIEPRVTYNFIPDIDKNDREKIRAIDAVDSVNPVSSVTYFLTQRLLMKEVMGEDNFQTREIMRFDISQTYDLREATRALQPGLPRRPFGELRFDFDSRLSEALLLNFDTTYNIYDDTFNTVNLEFGIKPTSSLSLIMERRYTRNNSTFLLGTLDWAFSEGWRFQGSTRFDGETDTFRENALSLLYDNKCRCWGFSIDFISRDIVAEGTRRDETKIQFEFILRGLGSIRSGRETLIHRSF